VRLDSQVGISAAVDEISVARCGVEPPKYEAKLIDAFERPNSRWEDIRVDVFPVE
jgi:hypothetical protein